MRGFGALLVAICVVAVTAGAPTAAAGAHSDCDTYRLSMIPIIHPAYDVGEVELCDEDRNGIHDTATFDTQHVPAEGIVSLTDETKQRTDHQDRAIDAHARVSPGAPMKPIVSSQASAQDEGNDGNLDRIGVEANAHNRLTPSTQLMLVLLDENDDGIPDVVAPLVCAPGAGCVAGPDLVPEVPERVDLPDTVVRLPFVGYVP